MRRSDGGVNVGIAIVTPAKKILETLNHPEFARERAKIAAVWEKKHAGDVDTTASDATTPFKAT